MSDGASWLGRRRPAPPRELAERIRQRVGSGPSAEAAELAAVARDALSRARGRPGRVRASAFDLLEADALLTYACEAALESDDPHALLLEVLESSTGP